MAVRSEARSLVVLDDDPTGTQAVSDVPVLLRWAGDAVERALNAHPPAVYLITNTRALAAREAEAVTADAATAGLRADPMAELVVRGDSTLRGHVLEEYRAVRTVRTHRRPPVLLLVPALPAAGRVTRDGVHCIMRGGRAVPLHLTEYADDGAFAYDSSRLLEWASARSGGFFAAERGTEVPGTTIRDPGGANAVTQAILRAWNAGGPAACAPDAETLGDLRKIAKGLREAQQAGAEVIVRCAPAFAGILSGKLATGFVSPPSGAGGTLLICGSYVPDTRRQLAHLSAQRGLTPIELDPLDLLGSPPTMTSAVKRAAVRSSLDMREHGVAVVATAAERPDIARNPAVGMRVARALASVVTGVYPPPAVLISKGGITSAITLEYGVGATAARVVGPLLPGVALWDVDSTQRKLSYIVVPGNVGGDGLLTDLINLLMGG